MSNPFGVDSRPSDIRVPDLDYVKEVYRVQSFYRSQGELTREYPYLYDSLFLRALKIKATANKTPVNPYTGLYTPFEYTVVQMNPTETDIFNTHIKRAKDDELREKLKRDQEREQARADEEAKEKEAAATQAEARARALMLEDVATLKRELTERVGRPRNASSLSSIFSFKKPAPLTLTESQQQLMTNITNYEPGNKNSNAIYKNLETFIYRGHNSKGFPSKGNVNKAYPRVSRLFETAKDSKGRPFFHSININQRGGRRTHRRKVRKVRKVRKARHTRRR